MVKSFSGAFPEEIDSRRDHHWRIDCTLSHSLDARVLGCSSCRARPEPGSGPPWQSYPSWVWLPEDQRHEFTFLWTLSQVKPSASPVHELIMLLSQCKIMESNHLTRMKHSKFSKSHKCKSGIYTLNRTPVDGILLSQIDRKPIYGTYQKSGHHWCQWPFTIKRRINPLT